MALSLFVFPARRSSSPSSWSAPAPPFGGLVRDPGAQSRHLLYAATLVDHGAISQAWRFPLAAWLTDETFAVMDGATA